MRVDQSNRATGLFVPWVPDGSDGVPAAPAHARLAALLRAQVTQGRLRPGDRLPPSRALAEELGLSRWVVTETYDQLKAEGYLTGRVGAGTVVASGVRTSPAGPAADLRDAPPDGPASARAASGGAPSGLASSGATSGGTSSAVLDLSPALPDLASFPRVAWRAALGRALADTTDADLAGSDPAGVPALRATIADYLRRVRGVEADPARVLVTGGVRNGVWLVCDVLRRAGARRVAVEDPCWPRLREAARDSGLDVVPVPVDGEGMRVDTLRDLDLDAVFVAPTHQFPTGVPLSAARRLALVGWAATGGRVVVEDDYDAEFRYDRRPVGALAALAPEHVVYLGSTSKTLSPGLHLGWLVAPDRLTEPLVAARRRLGALAATPDQHAFVRLVESGAYDRHLRRMRRAYQRRRTAMLGALGDAVPGQASPSMDAGLHVLWLLPDGVAEAAVLRAARDRGIAMLGLAQCRLAAGPGGLVVGYGNVPEHRAGAVAATIGAAVRDVADVVGGRFVHDRREG
jgi:GntR family transcriptional regulator/MocR family aminotransferase